jgi:hypothetical protein
MLPRKNLCNTHFNAKSCELRTKPLLDYEAYTTMDQLSPRERGILKALHSLVVIEDFCLPAECDEVESDKKAIFFAFFQDPRSGNSPGGLKYQPYGDKQMELVCGAPESNMPLAIGGSIGSLFCFAFAWFLMKPPKMPREYRIRRTTEE